MNDTTSEKRDTYRVFKLDELGIDSSAFINALESDAQLLEWDTYDVRREQLTILHRHLPELYESVKQELKEYYLGNRSNELVERLAGHLPEEVKAQFQSLQPYRRRSVARLLVEPGVSQSSAWKTSLLEPEGIAQDVSSDDIRSMPRSFKETSSTVTESDQFLKLVSGVADMVAALQSDFKAIEMTCWHTGIVARPKKTATNAPEGIHQDGADYIVSALVLDRQGVTGGTSRIFGPDKKTVLLEHTLQVGEGIFQSDSGSNLWHDVTPIQVDKQTANQGERRTLGFDIRIRR